MFKVNTASDSQLNIVDELEELLDSRVLNQTRYDSLCSFMILFSLAEAKLKMDGVGGTCIFADKLVECSGFDSEVIDDCYQYFIQRHREEDLAEERFLKLAPTEHVKGDLRRNFITLLEKTDPTQADKISLVFKVMYRLRHNLFHGTKWSHNLSMQDGLFSHANCVLKSCLWKTRLNWLHA
ncbi:hypothetical protein FQN67_16960 [Salmonella enterica]|nr:hypothetical protein [Salmonella enterica]